MDNMNGMTPVGLVEGEFRVTTSSIPNYQTKHLGLTQYTPNRVTSWLGNYNDDMRKIDNFSSSIGAYVEKVIEDGDAAHQELNRRINDTVSMIAVVERRVDRNFEEHEEIRTNIQQVETGAAQKIIESEKRLVEMIQQNNTSTSSTLAYVQQQVTDNDTKHTLAESQLNQRVHVVEDEVAAIKEHDTAFRSELDSVKSTVATHTSSIADLEEDVTAAQGDATTANNKANANATQIAGLKTSQAAQDATIGTLQTRVGELATVGEDVNELKASRVFYAEPSSSRIVIDNGSLENIQISLKTNPDGIIEFPNSIIVNFNGTGFTKTTLNINFNIANVNIPNYSIIFIPRIVVQTLANLDSSDTVTIKIKFNNREMMLIAGKGELAASERIEKTGLAILRMPNLKLLSATLTSDHQNKTKLIFAGYDWYNLNQSYI